MSAPIRLLGLPYDIEQDCLRYVALSTPKADLKPLSLASLNDTPPASIDKLAYLATPTTHDSVMRWANASPSAIRPGLLVLVPARAEAPTAASPRISALMTLPSPIAVLAQQLLTTTIDLSHAIPITPSLAYCTQSKSLIDPEGIHPHLALTDKEAALLAMLLGAHSRTVAREELMSHVWGHDQALDTHTLETHIYRLRTKLSSRLHTPAIHTTPEGYRFQL